MLSNEVLNEHQPRTDFTHDQLPPQEWYKRETEERSTCNEVTPARSLLAHFWTMDPPRTLRVESQAPVDVRARHSPTGVPGFMMFGAQPDTASTTRTDTTSPTPLDGGDGLGRIELLNLREAIAWSGDPAASARASSAVFASARHQNIMGPTDAEGAAIASIIVELLGPTSKAADVVLSHSLLACNDRLSESLLKAKVKLTLEHIQIILKVSSRTSRVTRAAVLTRFLIDIDWRAYTAASSQLRQAGFPFQGFARGCPQRA